MITVLLIMSAGILIGWIFHSKIKFLRITEFLTNWAIYLLLFMLGLSVGTNDTILKNFGEIGLQAITLTLFAVLGSVLTAWLTYNLFFKKK